MANSNLIKIFTNNKKTNYQDSQKLNGGVKLTKEQLAFIEKIFKKPRVKTGAIYPQSPMEIAAQKEKEKKRKEEEAKENFKKELNRFKSYLYSVEASEDVMKNKQSTTKKPDGSYYKAFEGGMHYPYLDVKGKLTIGIGHNISDSKIDYSGGITSEEADNLLQKDIDNSLRLSKVYYDSEYGEGEFDKIPSGEQFMLTDYTFNLGKLSKFPKFTDAIYLGDTEKALEEYKRYVKYDDGTKEELGRNKDYLNEYLIPWINETNSKKGPPYI